MYRLMGGWFLVIRFVHCMYEKRIYLPYHGYIYMDKANVKNVMKLLLYIALNIY